MVSAVKFDDRRKDKINTKPALLRATKSLKKN